MWQRARRIVIAWALAAAVMPTAARAACQDSPQQVFGKVAPAVVSVLAISIDPFTLPERVIPGLGSGIVIDDRGHVLTNSHVVYGSSSLAVTTSRDEIFDAELVGADPILDLAVLRIAAPAGRLRVAPLGDSDGLAIGQEVIAIGNPFGLGPTITRGIVSGLNRVVERSPMSWLSPLIQTDAAINPGNSGGPLVDLCSEVIGINTLTAERADNISFAVPINLAKGVIPQLIREGHVIRPWHGISGKIVDLRLQMLLRIPLVPGFLVETVEPGSPAAKIGLKGGSLPVRIGAQEYILGGDIITKVDDTRLLDLQTVVALVKSFEVGDKIAIEYVREGRPHEVEVVLPERPILPGDLREQWRRRPGTGP